MRAQTACIGAMTLALILYAGAIGAGFAWDDELLFNSWLPYLDSPLAILSPPAEIPNFTFQYFRPVVLASYVADEWLASIITSPEALDQGRRIVFHLTPVLLHVACTGLVFLLGLRLAHGAFVDRRHAVAAPFAGALLFAVHPIHVESVAWIAGRSDPLCTLFGLSSLLALVHWRERGRPGMLLLAGALLLLGLLGKESAAGIVLPAGVIVLAWPRGDDAPRAGERGHRRELLCLAAAFVVYATLRGMFGADAGFPVRLVDAGAAAARVLGSAGWYLAKLVWPFPQNVFPPQRLDGMFVLLGLVAASLAAAGAYAWRRTSHRAERVALALTVGGLLAPLAVAATSLATSPVAERHLYLSSAGACLLLAFTLTRMLQERRLAALPHLPLTLLLAIVIAVPWSVAVSQRIRVWDDPLRFWQAATTSAPGSAVARINLGQALTIAGRFAEAEQAYRHATELADAPDQRSMASTNLGSLYMRQGKIEPAIEQFAQALAINARDASALFNWASAIAHKARAETDPARRAALRDRATQRLDEALLVHPRYAKAHLLLGTILLERGRTREARTRLEAVAAIAPGSGEARRAGELLAKLGPD